MHRRAHELAADAETPTRRARPPSGRLRSRRPRRLLRLVPGRPRGVDLKIRHERDHRVHRPVRVRQDHGAALPQPDERPHPRCPRRGRGHLPRRRPVRPRVSATAGAPPHRHGVPEAEPVPEEHLRQRRLRPAAQRHQEARASSTTIVEKSLRGAALWDEVKDRLEVSALGMSGGQQQRLCIARAIAVEPEVVLMDEPCSALDPIATARIEDLMQELKSSTRSSSSPTTCSRRPASATAPPSSPPRSTSRAIAAPGVLVEFGAHHEDLLEPRRRANRELRHREVRLIGRAPPHLSTSDLDDAKSDLVRLGRARHRDHPTGHRGAARRRSRGRRLHHPRRRRDRRTRDRHRGALLPHPGAAGAGGERPPPADRRC